MGLENSMGPFTFNDDGFVLDFSNEMFFQVLLHIGDELRGIQKMDGPQKALDRWEGVFARKHPDYTYDTVEQRVIRRNDKQAFNKLYEVMQEAGTIAARAIRDGEPGYKRALKQIMEICRSVE